MRVVFVSGDKHAAVRVTVFFGVPSVLVDIFGGFFLLLGVQFVNHFSPKI